MLSGGLPAFGPPHLRIIFPRGFFPDDFDDGSPHLTHTHIMFTYHPLLRTGLRTFPVHKWYKPSAPVRQFTTTPHACQPLQLKKVLILSKQTRYETEVTNLESNTDTTAAAAASSPLQLDQKQQLLQREISKRGLNYNRLSHSYYSHLNSLQNIVTELKRNNIDYTIVTATRDLTDDFPESYLNYDAILSAGGDGTFLKAASEMYTLDVPLIGINTDPNKSKGALCTVHDSIKFGQYLQQIQAGDYEWRQHSRIRVQLEKDSGMDTLEWTQLKQVALNEIFFAERNVAHPIQHEVIVDQQVSSADVQLSSGILICTGTGSSAWMANASKIDTDIVRQVLNMTRSVLNNTANAKDTADVLDAIDVTTMDQIAETLGKERHFDVGSADIKYFVREVVSNGLRPPCKNKQGLHQSVTIRSRGWDPTMTLDGIHTFPLPAGQRAHFDTDPSVALRTLTFGTEDRDRKR